MEITDVKTFLCEARPGSARYYTFVKVCTDEGLTGVGESFGWGIGPAVTEAVVKHFKRVLVGQDPFNIEYLWKAMYRECSFFTTPVPFSGIDIALWDVIGKKLRKPVCDLIGGRTRDRVRVYSHAGGRTPEELAKSALGLVEEGYRAVKFDPFGPRRSDHLIERSELRRAEEKVKAVRDAVGEDVDVCLEAHARFSLPVAVKIGRALEKYDLMFYEEPLPPENVDAMAKVAAHLDVPIATGERLFTRYQFRDYIEKKAADILQPDLINTGGISEVKKIAEMAEAAYIGVAPHNPNGPVCTMASVHLCAAISNLVILEYVAHDVPWREEIATPVEVENGDIRVPTDPGLGMEINEEEIAEHPVSELSFLYDWMFKRSQVDKA